MAAVRGALDERVAQHALEVAIDDLRRRMEAAEPTKLEAELSALDTKIERALDLAIELGDVPAAKDRLRTLRAERERVAGELARVRLDLPTVEDLLPRLRERLRDLEQTLKADVVRGRLVLGGLLAGRRLRGYADGRIEGGATLAPEKLWAPRRLPRPTARDVAGGRNARVCGLPMPLDLPIDARLAGSPGM